MYLRYNTQVIKPYFYFFLRPPHRFSPSRKLLEPAQRKQSAGRGRPGHAGLRRPAARGCACASVPSPGPPRLQSPRHRARCFGDAGAGGVSWGSLAGCQGTDRFSRRLLCPTPVPETAAPATHQPPSPTRPAQGGAAPRRGGSRGEPAGPRRGAAEAPRRLSHPSGRGRGSAWECHAGAQRAAGAAGPAGPRLPEAAAGRRRRSVARRRAADVTVRAEDRSGGGVAGGSAVPLLGAPPLAPGGVPAPGPTPRDNKHPPAPRA